MKFLKSINVRYITAAIMFIVFIPFCYITNQLKFPGRIVGIVGYSLGACWGIYEFGKSEKLNPLMLIWLVLYSVVGMYLPKRAFLEVVNNNDIQNWKINDLIHYGKLFDWSTFALPAIGSLLIITDGKTKGSILGYIKRYLFIYFVSLIIPTIMKVLWIINISHWQILLFLVFIPILSDSFAYIGGTLFGKHKMCPSISPNKTWEGAISGWIFAVIWIFIVGYFLKIYDFNSGGSTKILGLALSGILLPVISPMGDLFFSYYKRTKNIKDFSKVFPGHGGLLDRIDALIFVIIVWTIIILVI